MSEQLSVIKVAVVEDTAMIRESLVMFLKHTEGFDCVGAFASAEEALQLLPDVHPDVTIMDIGLPGLSGIECVRALKATCPTTQFLMCTVFEDDSKIFEALKAGASGYILKKTPPTEILNAIKDLHNGGAPMSGAIARKVIALMVEPKKNLVFELLSDREKEVLTLLSKGFRYKEISTQLHISFFTVSTHVHNIYEKLQVQSRAEAVNKVFPR